MILAKLGIQINNNGKKQNKQINSRLLRPSMQPAIEIYIYILRTRHRRQSTSEKIHKKGTGESTGDKRRETFDKKREARFF